MRSRIAALLCLSALTLAAGCHSTKPRPEPLASESQTQWLQSCAADSDCGELACICGICTLTCDSDASCAGLDDASCEPVNTLPSATCPAMLEPPAACVSESPEPAACAGAECGVAVGWPPLPADTDTCECGEGQVCGAGGCEPACDGEGHCAVWPVIGERVRRFEALADRVVWVTEGASDPAGNPMTGDSLWMARAGDPEATLIDGDIEGNIIDMHDGLLLLTDGQGRMASLVAQQGAVRSEWTPMQLGDFGSARFLSDGIVYGSDPQGRPWSAPLDGSSAPEEIQSAELSSQLLTDAPVELSDLHLLGVAGGYLFMRENDGWGTIVRLDLSTTPASPSYIEVLDHEIHIFKGIVFGNFDGDRGTVWDVQTLEPRSLFGPDDGTGSGVWNPTMLDEWFYYVRSADGPFPEDIGPQAGVWRVPVRAYGEPERVVSPEVINATVPERPIWRLTYGVNRDGMYWFNSDGGRYIYHRDLAPPACTTDNVCGRGTCVQGECQPGT